MPEGVGDTFTSFLGNYPSLLQIQFSYIISITQESFKKFIKKLRIFIWSRAKQIWNAIFFSKMVISTKEFMYLKKFWMFIDFYLWNMFNVQTHTNKKNFRSKNGHLWCKIKSLSIYLSFYISLSLSLFLSVSLSLYLYVGVLNPFLDNGETKSLNCSESHRR